MQVDLYDVGLRNDVNRRRKQVLTRKFKINPRYADLSNLDQYFTDPLLLKKYKDYLRQLLAEGRKYKHIGDADCDNLFLLEAMNLGDSAKSYSMVADFSGCLDLVLSDAFGCKREDIRSIENYDEISHSILNYNFENVPDVTFSALIDASEEIEQAFASLSKKAQQLNLNYDNRLPWVVYNFYSKVLDTLSMIKSYSMISVCKKIGLRNFSKGVYRSMSYAAAVATVDVPFNEIVTLHYLEKDLPDYEIAFRSYAPFEYIGEEIRYDFSRNLQC